MEFLNILIMLLVIVDNVKDMVNGGFNWSSAILAVMAGAMAIVDTVLAIMKKRSGK